MRVRLAKATPVFLVRDIASMMQWYREVLGFEADHVPKRPPHAFCILRRDAVTLFLQQLDGYQRPDHYGERDGGVWNVYLETVGVQELFATLSQRSDVTLVQTLHRQPYHQTEFEIRDPDGYLLVFAEPW